MMTKAVIALASENTDYGHVPAAVAEAEAQTIANEDGKPVTLRDPVTDRVLATVEPMKGGAVSGGSAGHTAIFPNHPAFETASTGRAPRAK